MYGQTEHLPLKTPNLPDKCAITNLQACYSKIGNTVLLEGKRTIKSLATSATVNCGWKGCFQPQFIYMKFHVLITSDISTLYTGLS